MSTRNTDSPSVRFFACFARRGARQQQHQIGMLGARRPDLLAVDDVVVALAPRVVRMRVVSVPVVGSVTPNACRRNSPEAIFGRYRAFCAALPCRSSVPIVYICAWQAPPLQPEAWISSRMAAAAVMAEAAAAEFLGDERGEEPASVSAATNSVGIGALAVEPPPILAGKARAQRAHRFADRCEIGGVGHDRDLGAAVVDGDHVALDHAGAKAHDIAVAPHLGADGFARERPERRSGR